MIKYKFIHNRKNNLKKDGTGLVQLEIYADRKRKYLSTEIYVSPANWDNKSGKVSHHHSRADEFNMILHDLIQKLESVLRKTKLLEREISAEEILSQLTEETPDTLADFITKEVAKDNRIKAKTKVDLINTRNKLIEFKSDARLQDVDYKFIVDFDNHLRAKEFSISTIGKLHKNLKRFLNLAINYKLLSPNDYPYRNFKVERETKKREALSQQDVTAIEMLVFDRGSVNEIVKEMFLFACYTGLRISDIIRLETCRCKLSHLGWRLEFKSFKSRKAVYLPLNSLFMQENQLSKPEQILVRYFNEANDLVFPKLPESKINRHLKEIAKQAGIKKNVTFHMGRHTFGTIMATKIPLPTLQSLMQHSDIKTTMIYVNMSKDMIDESLDKVNWKI